MVCYTSAHGVLEDPSCNCEYHTWLHSTERSKNLETPQQLNMLSRHLKLPECNRVNYLSAIDPQKQLALAVSTDQRQAKRMCYEDMWFNQKRNVSQASTANKPAEAIKPGMLRLLKFKKVLSFLGTAPWAKLSFDINETMLDRLTASHLSLIVGKEYWTDEKATLYRTISATEDLSNTQNVCWITNRQQGKTTTLSRFLAALSMCSPTGGNLVCVYSTSLDRAQELTRAAKKYLYWMQSTDTCKEFMTSLEFGEVEILQDNERVYTIKSQYNSLNTILARPKNADSCRGDAPKAAIFDEIGFVTSDFWYKFAYPLLQVGQRVFTCATTPPASGSFFSVFIDKIKEQNECNDFFFRLTNHSLVCLRCAELGVAHKCVHKLGLIPPWKSLLRFTQMKRLVPQKRMKDYEAEVYGVLQPDGARYFPAKLVESIIIKRKHIEKNVLVGSNPAEQFKNPVVYIGIDPASHQRSSMGLAAVSYGTEGQIVVMGGGSVAIGKCEVIQVQMVIMSFVGAVIQHPWFALLKPDIVPIIECNNNEQVAASILSAVKSECSAKNVRVVMPFKKSIFSTGITDNLGVWTTDTNKLASITNLYTNLLDARVFFVKRMATTVESFKANSKKASISETRELLAAQLKNFRDLSNGKVSGKTDNDEDDLAMAILLATYWSFCVRATTALE